MTASSSSGAFRRSRPRRTQGVGWHRVGRRRRGRPASIGARPHVSALQVMQARRQSAPARPSKGQHFVCATSKSGAAAFGRAERALALEAHKPALCAHHTAAHDW